MTHPYETWKDVEVVEKALWALGLTNYESDKFEKNRCYEIEPANAPVSYGHGPNKTVVWSLASGLVYDVWDGTEVVKVLTVENAEQVARYLRGE
jgi:hypothetical protein